MRITQINALPAGEVQAEMSRARPAQLAVLLFQHRLPTERCATWRCSAAPSQSRAGRCSTRSSTTSPSGTRAEEALRQSEEQFRAMFETASIGMAQADVRTGQWLRVNAKMCEITGYTADEMLASARVRHHPPGGSRA